MSSEQAVPPCNGNQVACVHQEAQPGARAAWIQAALHHWVGTRHKMGKAVCTEAGTVHLTAPLPAGAQVAETGPWAQNLTGHCFAVMLKQH